MDIFSLGCVYIEIPAVLLYMSIEDFAHCRRDNHDGFYLSPLPKVEDWVEKMKIQESHC